MPKKHHKSTFSKPISAAHHTLGTSGARSSQNDRFRSGATSSGEQRSVNDLINHLRRTQVSAREDNSSPSTFITPRSVHPSLRNLLEFPDIPPPRPRPDARRSGVVDRRLRRTAGPPPPESWLASNSTADNLEDNDHIDSKNVNRVIYRLDRLPGRDLPLRTSFLHTVLKSMALHWRWHLEYDGQFLGMLPTHIKALLLSYIAVFSRDQPLGRGMQGLRPLFEKHRAIDDDPGQPSSTDSEVTHLDLSNAIGRWLQLKQLSTELFVARKQPSAEVYSRKSVPFSWEDEYGDDSEPTPRSFGSIPKSPQGLRFENLQYLSLAHPAPASVNWNSLINLLSRLSTITHLSLAHWPVPTVTPNAINTRIRHPIQTSLTLPYGGTDSYSAMENNWAEAAGVLRRLSRVTYCLKWLDLEGCGDWIPALNWEGVGPNGEAYPTGPEWNGSWRDIEWMRLGPGWIPPIEDSELLRTTTTAPSQDIGEGPSIRSPLATSRSLTSSIHAPFNAREVEDLPWDVEVERRKYRLSKELGQYREIVGAAKAVQQRVLRARKEGRGKWVHFSFGLEDLDYDVLRKLLGSEFSTFFP